MTTLAACLWFTLATPTPHPAPPVSCLPEQHSAQVGDMAHVKRGGWRT